jgi:hypothetical protein
MPPRLYNVENASLPNHTAVAIQEARRRFAHRGVPLTIAGTVQERKAGERRLACLKSWGYVSLYGPNNRRTGAKLTRKGDDLARWITASDLLIQSWPWLFQIAALVSAGCSNPTAVRETDLAQADYGSPERRRLIDLEFALLPLKAAGLIRDWPDAHGRIYYAMTDTGLAAIERDAPAPRDLPDYPGSTWSDLHAELMARYEAERLQWTAEQTNEVFIPLPVSGPPYITWRDVADQLPPPPFRNDD